MWASTPLLSSQGKEGSTREEVNCFFVFFFLTKVLVSFLLLPPFFFFSNLLSHLTSRLFFDVSSLVCCYSIHGPIFFSLRKKNLVKKKLTEYVKPHCDDRSENPSALRLMIAVSTFSSDGVRAIPLVVVSFCFGIPIRYDLSQCLGIFLDDTNYDWE